MKPTEDLIREHNAIIIMLGIMDKIAAFIRDNDDVDIDDITKIADFLQVFAERCHHAKEEKVLFPALVLAGVAEDNGPIGVMLYEHAMARNFIEGINTGIEKFNEGYSGSLLVVAQNFSNYTFLLRNHINKENNILFPMADKLLDSEKRSAMLSEFKNMEKEILGDTIYERYFKLLEKLKDKYIVVNSEEVAYNFYEKN